jgi:hypothetical protein
MPAKVGGAESKISDPALRPSARIFSLEHAQLLTEGTDLETEVVPGTEEAAKAGEKPKGKWRHGTGFIA